MADKRNRTPFYGAVPTSKLQADHVFMADGEDLQTYLDNFDPGTSAADYVIEEGTDGIWTYRKWNSGIAECWGTQSFTGINGTAWGNQYTANVGYVDYPVGLFITTPKASLVTPVAGYAGACSYNGNEGLSENHTQGIQLVRPTTVSNASFTLSYYSVGQWKY